MEEEQDIVVTMPRLEKWQKDLFDLYEQYPKGKIFVTKAVRLVGKSICLELLLIYASYKEAGSSSKVISPVYQQSTKLFQDICNIADQLIKRANAAELKIIFKNGSVIDFSSGLQGDNIRGYTVRKAGILAIDEAAYIDDELFYQICLPMVNVYNGDVFLFSTPRAKQGFFYEMFMNGLDPDNGKVISCDWTEYDTSKYLSRETLEIYRKQLPEQAFRSEYLGEWIEGSGSAFGDIKGCINKAPELTGIYYFGIDWSGLGGSDYTSITVLNNKAQMMEIKYFNDKDETETINIIVGLIAKWMPKKVTVELNSIGRVFYGLLDKAVKRLFKNVIVEGFMTTNESKDNIISNMQVHFLNLTMSILPDAELIKQLNNYEMSFSKTGKRIFNNRPGEGMHDDCVISTAICLHSIQKGTYKISIV